MVNQFITVLMNAADSGDVNSFIAPGYSQKTLPAGLVKLHSALFPSDSSTDYRQFLAFCYVRLLRATGMDYYETLDDSRLTYDLSKITKYFKIFRKSVPVTTATDYSLVTYGELAATTSAVAHYDTFVIKQIGFTTDVSVYSTVQKKFLKDSEQFTSESPDSYIALQQDGASNQTKEVKIGATGLSFVIMGDMSTYTVSGNKQWSFTAEAPYTVDLLQLYKKLRDDRAQNEQYLQLFKNDETTKLLRIWQQDESQLRQLAAFISNLYVQINNL